MIRSVRKGFRSWREVSLAPFQQTLFRSLWIAALVSNVGAAMQAVGASWAMTSMSASPQTVALVQTAAMLPIVLLALPAGALADNIDRRSLMLGAQVLGLSSSAILTALSFSGLLNPSALLAFTALIGSAVALYQPAWQASLADFVPRSSLPAAVSLNVMGFNIARSVGPAIGGAVIAWTTPSFLFAFNALSFLTLICVLAVAHFPKADRRHPPEGIILAMAAGLRFVGMSPTLQRIYLRGGLFGLGASAVWSLLPVVARTQLAAGPMTFGLLMGALGCGSLCGAATAIWVRSTVGNNLMVTCSSASFGIVAIGIALSSSPALSACLAFVAGVSWIFVFTTTRTCVQLSSPRWVVGRAVSLGQVASFGCMSIGAACWGTVASHFGLANTLMLSGAFLLLSTSAAPLAKLPLTDSGDETALAHSPTRPPRVPLDGRTGPVVVTIEYEVPADRAREFLELINALGRARRRNGATAWTIQQDIDRPEAWIERIHSPTWSDHLRRLDRYTAEERRLASSVEPFRISRRPPVRRMVERPRGSLPLS